MAINGGFAAGLAQGINNGVNLYNAYQSGQKRKREQKIDDAIADAMKAKGLDPDSQSPMMLAAGPQSSGAETFAVQSPADVGGGAQAQPSDAGGAQTSGAQTYPVQPPAPMQSQPVMGQAAQGVSGQAAGLQDAASPGLATALQQDQQADALGLSKKKDAQAPAQGYLGGGEFGEMSDSLTRGIHKALELGAPAKAINLMVAREKVVSQYRDQALGEAMNRFDLTGDANAFVPFFNRFMPTSVKLDNVEQHGQTADGQPVYVAHGTNMENGQPFEHAFSRQSLTQYVSAAGDGATYRTMFVDQAKHLWDMQKFRNQEHFKTDERIREKTTLNDKGIGADKEPADVRTAKWLVGQGVAKNTADAWNLVKGARAKSRQDFALDYAKSILTNQRNDFGGDKVAPKDALQQGMELYDSMNGGSGSAAGSAAAAPKAPAAGTIEGGYKFKGGDPADAANWEKQ